MSAAANSYDEAPYPSFAYPSTHPDRLATVATLFGLRPPALEKAKVLEIGCASGGNLIPMAEQFPQAMFVGIDLSVRQVVEGQDLIRNCGLLNVQIHHRNVLEVGDDLGKFDYIICHNVFSGVFPDAQEKILSICKRNLTPDGIAYVSYNTRPGWLMRGVARDMVVYHAQVYPNPGEHVRQARGVLEFLAKSINPQNNPYGAVLQAEIEQMRRVPDAMLFHDFLEERPEPISFSEFNRRAEKHGLRFVGEADARAMLPQLAKEAEETLKKLHPNHLYLEQYIDFLRNRAVRHSLLCHADRQPSYALKPDALANLWIATSMRPQDAQIDFATDKAENFVVDNGSGATVREPIVKSALAILGAEWPRQMSFHVLRHRARARFEPGPVLDAGAVANDAQLLGMALYQFQTAGLVEFSTRQAPVAARAGERPVVGLVSRNLSASGKPAVTLRHETVFLGPFERQLLHRLDGTHDRAGLRDALAKLIRDGVLTVQKDGVAVTDEKQIAESLEQTIERQLALFARQSLLVEGGH
jgi:methyltransferase-like protein/SAM-dependent methyltransferase